MAMLCWCHVSVHEALFYVSGGFTQQAHPNKLVSCSPKIKGMRYVYICMTYASVVSIDLRCESVK